MDTLGAEPRLHLSNPRWPIVSSADHGPAANVVRGTIEASHLGAGSRSRGATVRNSIIRREVLLEEDVVVEDSIILDFCVLRRGARGHVTESDTVVVPIAPARGDTNMHE